jgi:hypothetical protein
MHSLIAAAETFFAWGPIPADFWYALPLIIAISFVYEATRNERMLPILCRGLRLTVIGLGALAGMLAILWFWARFA